MQRSKLTRQKAEQPPLVQTTLYNLRFGKRSLQKDSDSESPPDAKKAKVERSDDGDVEACDDDGHGGTTTDASALVQVTRAAFLDAYKVGGLSDVYYCRNWVSATQAHTWRRELDALPQWYRPTLRVYGREIRQSRAIAAFATTPGVQLNYSGHQVTMHAPFPPVLERIAARLARDDCLGAEVKFNHCMLNRYEDGDVYIGKHSDNKENKVIVTVSLGAERTWVMEDKMPRGSKSKGDKHRWTLHNGSILVMQGDAQQRYTHEIPKERKVKEPRISITFRQLVDK